MLLGIRNTEYGTERAEKTLDWEEQYTGDQLVSQWSNEKDVLFEGKKASECIDSPHSQYPTSLGNDVVPSHFRIWVGAMEKRRVVVHAQFSQLFTS